MELKKFDDYVPPSFEELNEKLYWLIYSGGKRTEDVRAKQVADHAAVARDWVNMMIIGDNYPSTSGKYWIVGRDDNGDGVLQFVHYDRERCLFETDIDIVGWTTFNCELDA